MDISAHLKQAKKYISSEAIELTDEVLSYMKNDSLRNEAKENAANIAVTRVVYQSKTGKTVGYIVEPLEKIDHALIWNRGGTGDFGAIKQGMLFVDLARFARAGFVVFATQYPGVDGGEGKDMHGGDDIHTVLDLYDLIEVHPNASVEKISMYGHSRGGMMIYRALTMVSWIKNAVSIAAPVDYRALAEARSDWRKTERETYGDSDTERDKRSAVRWFEKMQKVPLKIFHAKDDERIPVKPTLECIEKLEGIDYSVTAHIFETGGHMLREHADEIFDESVEWLKSV